MWSKWSQLPLWILVLACTSSSAQTVSEPSECSTLMSAADQCILVGPIWVRIRKVTSSIIGYAHADLSTSVEGTTITSNLSTTPFVADENETFGAFIDRINESHPGFTIQLSPDRNGVTNFVAQTDTRNATKNLSLSGDLVVRFPGGSADSPRHTHLGLDVQNGPPNFVITIPDTLKAAILKQAPNATISIRGVDASAYYNLLDTSLDTQWILTHDMSPFAVVTVGTEGGRICAGTDLAQAQSSDPCHWQALLVRRVNQKDIVVGVQIIAAPGHTATAHTDGRPNSSELLVSRDLLSDMDSTYSINGKMITPYVGPFTFRPYANVWKIDWTKKQLGCRKFPINPNDAASVSLEPYVEPPSATDVANGIEVGSVKVYDTIALKRMLNDTAAQLASISGFNAAPITAALGNLQGVTRDTSYLSAQVTTTPLPTITQTNGNNLAANSSMVGASATPGSSTSTVTIQCPNGSVPTIGTNGVQGCTVVPPGTPATGSTSTETLNGSTQAPSTIQQTNNLAQTQQNGTTTTSGGYAVSVPTAPVSSAMAAPTNIGVASADVLAEQVELNSQITTLRMLLQGASSDQYLLTNSRAVATRQQTTIGFTISLDPPRRFRHAVADVRIVVLPPEGQTGVSIMNMLPSEKTYNVAKVTSHQTAFGGGVVVEPISISGSTGRSKDRLYLAKDTDTLALQYPAPPPAVVPEPLTAREHIHDGVKAIVDLQKFKDCKEPTGDGNTIVFGWQFRPVLGAEFVKGGQRQVFAQLALPANLNDEYVPTVYVLTRWREYDPSKQVVGETYKGSCSGKVDKSGVALLTPLKVRDLRVNDVGNGEVQLSARGDFFASGMTVRAGSNAVSPTTFDGNSVELFANVHDVLQSGSLTVIGPNGQKSPFAVVTADGKEQSCGIASATLHAVPRPDGNSLVTLTTNLGSSYELDDVLDGEPKPFVLIGSQVYGLQETPFTYGDCEQGETAPYCIYKFVAPTATLRNAQSFLVRDIAWDAFRATGKVDFTPSFSNLAIASTTPYTASESSTSKRGSSTKSSTEKKETFYTVSGFDFYKIEQPCEDPANPKPSSRLIYERNAGLVCAKVFLGGDPLATEKVFKVITDNLATLDIVPSDTVAKSVRIQLWNPVLYHDSHDSGAEVEWDLALPKDEEAKAVASPSFMRVGDSQTVSFSGTDWSKCVGAVSISFDGVQKFTGTLNQQTKALDILIPTYVTGFAGHKELTATCTGSDGKPINTKLAVDVLKQ